MMALAEGRREAVSFRQLSIRVMTLLGASSGLHQTSQICQAAACVTCVLGLAQVRF